MLQASVLEAAQCPVGGLAVSSALTKARCKAMWRTAECSQFQAPGSAEAAMALPRDAATGRSGASERGCDSRTWDPDPPSLLEAPAAVGLQGGPGRAKSGFRVAMAN